MSSGLLTSPVTAENDAFDPSEIAEVANFTESVKKLDSGQRQEKYQELNDQQLEAFADLHRLQYITWVARESGSIKTQDNTNEVETKTAFVGEVNVREKWNWDVEPKVERDTLTSPSEIDYGKKGDTVSPQAIGRETFTNTVIGSGVIYDLFRWRHEIRWTYDNVAISVYDTSQTQTILYTDPLWTYQGTIGQWDEVNSGCDCIYTAFRQVAFEGENVGIPTGSANPYSKLEGDYVGNGFVLEEDDGLA